MIAPRAQNFIGIVNVFVALRTLSQKQPDLRIFSDGTPQEYGLWKMQIVQNLELMRDRYPTDLAQITYALNFVAGKAAKHIYVYRISGPFQVADLDGFMAQMDIRFGDHFEKKNTRADLTNLRFTTGGNFSEFLGQF